MAEDKPTTPGGQPQEKVEDRSNVGSVSPEDYALDRRSGSPGIFDEDKEHERLAPGDSRTPPATGGKERRGQEG